MGNAINGYERRTTSRSRGNASLTRSKVARSFRPTYVRAASARAGVKSASSHERRRTSLARRTGADINTKLANNVGASGKAKRHSAGVPSDAGDANHAGGSPQVQPASFSSGSWFTSESRPSASTSPYTKNPSPKAWNVIHTLSRRP